MDVALRPAVASDSAFLTEMLVAAAFWRLDAPTGTIDAVLQDPELAHYVVGWQQPGVLGVIAEADQPVGAAWLRLFTADDPVTGSSMPRPQRWLWVFRVRGEVEVSGAGCPRH